MKRKIQKILCLILAGFFTFSCSEEESDKGNKIIPPKFHSVEDEGYWKGKSDTHVPKIISISSNKDEIEVTVPLQPTLSPRHYIEVIVLVKGKKQVSAKKFKPSFKKATAKFKINDSSPDDYWIVAKCNLHDMWRVKIEE